jgi:hypothetical protein
MGQALWRPIKWPLPLYPLSHLCTPYGVNLADALWDAQLSAELYYHRRVSINQRRVHDGF